MDFGYKRIADVVDALTGFSPDVPVGWEYDKQDAALDKYQDLLFEMVDRFGSYIKQKTDHAGRPNLYNYLGERSKALYKLGKQIIDDLALEEKDPLLLSLSDFNPFSET